MRSIPQKLIASCVKKKLKTKILKFLKQKSKKITLKSICSVCTNEKSRFLSKNEGSGLLSKLGIRTPLSQIAFLNILF